MLLTQVSPQGAELPCLGMLWMGTPWPAPVWPELPGLTCPASLPACCPAAAPSPCPFIPAPPCSNQGEGPGAMGALACFAGCPLVVVGILRPLQCGRAMQGFGMLLGEAGSCRAAALPELSQVA